MSKIEVNKYGSSQVANGTGVDRSRIEDHVSKIVDKRKLVVVTSGAVAAGRALYYSGGGEHLAETIENQKFFAGLGCTAVFGAFEEAFRNRGRMVASYPITHHDLDHSDQFLDAINLNLERGVVNIINEADAFSVTELLKLKTGGDNDGLAAHVAIALGAHSLTIITDKGGIYDDNKSLVEEVNTSNIEQIRIMIKDRAKSNLGRGGIDMKKEACWEAALGGVAARITDADGQNATRFVVG